MKTSNNSPFAPLAIGFFIGALTVGTAVLVWKPDREPRRYSVPAPSATSATRVAPSALDSAASSVPNATGSPDLDPTVARVAARFVCSCGSCGEERLDVCSCPTAREERAFIQDQLRNGHSEAEAAEAVKQKYGGLKS